MFFKFTKKREKVTDIDYLIVGLGNPGEKYEKTTHNSGSRTVSLLQKIAALPNFSKDNTLKSLTSKGLVEEKKIILLLPLTYMNLSGEAVGKLVKRENLPPEKIIVVYDDTDIELGKVRFSSSGGSAGHKGVLSIIKNLKTKNFKRVRIGVRKKQEKEREKALSFVLKNAPQELEKIESQTAEEIKNTISAETLFPKTKDLKK
jgi:peptidyl-tRNA hydrolase, PTH1 family